MCWYLWKKSVLSKHSSAENIDQLHMALGGDGSNKGSRFISAEISTPLNSRLYNINTFLPGRCDEGACGGWIVRVLYSNWNTRSDSRLHRDRMKYLSVVWYRQNCIRPTVFRYFYLSAKEGKFSSFLIGNVTHRPRILHKSFQRDKREHMLILEMRFFTVLSLTLDVQS